MALVGHISGSSQSNSVIGISGSVIIANRPNNTFPSLPGSDVGLYAYEKTLFGGNGVVSSGSISTVNGSGVSSFSVAATTGNTSVGGTLTTTGVSTLNGGLYVAGTTGLSSSLAIAGATNLASTLTTTGVSNLNGGLYVAGATGLSSSLAVAGAAAMASTLDVTGNFAVNSTKFTVTAATGAVSGSSTAAFGPTVANGSLTVTATGGTGNITAAGDLAVNGGDITTTSAAATIFSTGATAISIGSAATSMIVGVQGGTFTLNSNLAGKGTSNNIDSLSVTGSSGLSVTNNAIVGGNLTVTGDVTVNGSMTTINTTNLEVKDSVIGLGFSSGSMQMTAGDRGWIGGIYGGSNVMSKWDNDKSEFVFATTTSSATGSFGISSYSNLHANNIQGNIVSASLGLSGSLTKLIDGTSAFIAGTGITITSASNGAVTISTGAGLGDVSGPASSTGDAVALFNGTTGKLIKNSSLTTADGGASLFVNSNLYVSGSTTFGDATSDTVSFTARVATDLLPSADVTQNLGGPNNRWANVYTGDLHLRNDRGDFTLIEEENFLSIRFNKTGKRYKFVLEAVPELDEPPVLKF